MITLPLDKDNTLIAISDYISGRHEGFRIELVTFNSLINSSLSELITSEQIQALECMLLKETKKLIEANKH